MKSIGINILLRIKITLHLTYYTTINTVTLVDSGAAGYTFLNKTQVGTIGLTPKRLPRPRPLILADGRQGGLLSEYLILPMRVSAYVEMGLFYIAPLGDEDPVILGLL